MSTFTTDCDQCDNPILIDSDDVAENMNVDCEDCGSCLNLSTNNAGNLTIELCNSCKGQIQEDSYDEGYGDGKGDGYDKGYEAGQEEYECDCDGSITVEVDAQPSTIQVGTFTTGLVTMSSNTSNSQIEQAKDLGYEEGYADARKEINDA